MVYPHFNIPTPSSGIRIADAVVDSGYINTVGNNKIEHDIAFIRTIEPNNLPAYPAVYTISSQANAIVGPWQAGCPSIGNILTDPFAIQFPVIPTARSWFNYSGNRCGVDNALIESVGYPDVWGYDGEIDNTSAHNAYLSGSEIVDSDFGLDSKELYTLCGTCNTVTGINPLIWKGSSGGPLFGRTNDGIRDYNNWVLLGVVTNKVTSSNPFGPAKGFATGDFDYNHYLFVANTSWTPASLINISAPADNGTYMYNAIPSLNGTAGMLTASLQWRSNIDGYLGTGGNVSIANKLTPGTHTITATVAGSTVATKTIHLNVSAPLPTFEVLPVSNVVLIGNPSTANVLIPATANPQKGAFSFKWAGPGYPSLDLRAKVNGASNWGAPVWISASGTNGDNIPVNTTWQYGLFAHGDSANVLKTYTVKGVAAAAPTFALSPTHVIVPAGSTTGPFSFSWNAPGYETLDLVGQVVRNGVAGQWGSPVWIGGYGNNGDNIAVGDTYNYRFYPHGDTTHIIGTLSVAATR